jgi:hypothetical protein
MAHLRDVIVVLPEKRKDAEAVPFTCASRQPLPKFGRARVPIEHSIHGKQNLRSHIKGSFDAYLHSTENYPIDSINYQIS